MADLRCTGVTKTFNDHRVLSGIDLAVPHGTLTAILGASGSGKTTLLRLIMGFVHADAGKILVGSDTVVDAPRIHLRPAAREIGYVAQEGALFPHLTVGENVGFGLPRSERKAGRRIAEVMALVGLNGAYEKRRPHEISGGEQRRVALARALAPRPKMVLLDEPFSGLDAGLRSETREAVLAALAEEETTSVLVTHDQAEAMSMGKEVAILRGGHLAQTAAPDDVYHEPVDVDVARFVGEAVVLPGNRSGEVVRCVLGSLPVLRPGSDGPVLAMIRPEQIKMVEGNSGVEAEVTGFTFYGSQSMVKLTLDHEGVKYLLAARVFSHDKPLLGKKVNLSVAGKVMTYTS